MKLLLPTLALRLLLSVTVVAQGKVQLTMPPVIDADTATDIRLDLDWLTIAPGFETVPFEARSLGGSIPGPTITLSPGITLQIKFRNQLEAQEGAKSSFETLLPNGHQDADTGNLHFHGPHVSSILPADDTTLVVPPGQEYDYVIPFAEDHMPGTFWVHPHHHGSTSLQLGAGAALALIVKDPPGYLPAQIEEAEEMVLVFQDWDIPELKKAARLAKDARFLTGLESIEGGQSVGQRFVTVNGLYQPTLTMEQGKWYRWRILYAGWQDLILDLSLELNEAGCEMHLLAKDGIYIRDYPRSMLDSPRLPIPPGGRADVMIQCTNLGAANFAALSRSNILNLEVVDSNLTSTTEEESSAAPALEAWAPVEYPDYLQAVLDTPTTEGCDCGTEMDGYGDTSRVNGRSYRSGNVYMHTTFLGAIVSRKLMGIREHSYHQHVHPYQLGTGLSDKQSPYFQMGDWHDTILMDTTALTIKYRPVELPGKVIVHCHNSLHGDGGMMAKEYVRDLVEGGTCTCDEFGPIEGAGIVDNVETAVVVGGSPPSPTEAPTSTATTKTMTAISFVCWMSLVLSLLV